MSVMSLKRQQPWQYNGLRPLKEDKGFEPLRAFTRLTVFKTVPFSRTWVILHKLISFSWTLQDSNLRPDGYEPSALTN